MITHNTQIGERDYRSHIQSYVKDGLVVIDFNGRDMSPYQEWTIEDARAIATLLALAIADAELES